MTIDNERLRKEILDGNVKKWDLVSSDDEITVKVHGGHGYFGAFIIVPVGRKKMMIFIDDRDGICVPMLDGWYDDMLYAGSPWSPDTRFESQPNREPLLVKKGGKWNMIGYYGKRVRRGNLSLRAPYSDVWYDSISRGERVRCIGKDGEETRSWAQAETVERWYDAIKDGVAVRLTSECKPIDDGNDALIKEVKGWDNDRIEKEWIGKGRPCYSIHGYRFKGAGPHPITTEEAAKLIKKHYLGKGYNSLSWSIEDGKVALVFESYSEGDME